MDKPKYNTSILIFGLAFLVALAIRLAGLGGLFLNDAEAAWAVQALRLSQGVHPDIGAQPGLVLFSGALFYLFGATNFLARFVPALAGAFLVFAPAFFSDRIGKRAAWVAAFALALDPGLVAMSRQVDGHMLALSFTVLGLGFFYVRKPLAGGIVLGLALLGGTSLWMGWLGVLAAGLIYRIFRPKSAVQAQSETAEIGEAKVERSNFWRDALIGFACAVIFGGTLFFLEPKALSGVAGSLVAFITGQTGTPSVPASLVLAGWVFYAPLPGILAIIASIRAVLRKSAVDGFLAAWWLVALLLAVLYPAHQVADLVWALVPMWVLSARLVVQLFENGFPARLELIQAALTFVLLVSVWLNFVATQTNPGQDRTPYWAAMVFMVFFLGISAVLFTWGWSSRIAFHGLAIGLLALLTLYTLSTAWRSTGLVLRPQQELWRIGTNFAEADLLLKTTGDFSGWNTGEPNTLDIVVNQASPALEWLFRSYKNVDFESVLPLDSSPSLVVTGNQTSLSLAGAYTGQSFVKDESPNWSSMQTADWVEWMLFRNAPEMKNLVVLWVKSSLFPGSADFNLNGTNK